MLNDAKGFSRIIIACGRTDLRRGIDGLAAVVAEQFQLDPAEKNVLFLFCGTKTDRIKGIVFEGDGYNGYVERYEKAKARYDEITETLDARAAKGRAIDRFLRDISGRDELLAEFDAVLWLTVIDAVTVRRDGTLVFRFQDGRETEG